VDIRHAWATWIFARSCATGHSISRLLNPVSSDYGTTIDHASIASLARNTIEAFIVITYFTESGVSDEEWACRGLILDMHDCASRVRLFKGLKAEKQYNETKEALEWLREKLKENSYFKKFPSETQGKAPTGSVFYIRGFRTAAEKAGWNKEQFDAVHTYLSLPAHSAPMSFYRMDERKIDNKAIAPYQYFYSGFALEQACNSITESTKRIRELFPDVS